MPLECPREKMFCVVNTVLPVASSWIRQRYVVHLVSQLRRPRAVVERPRRQVFQKRQDGNLWKDARGKPNHRFAHLWKLRRRQEACRRLSRDCACARVDCFHGESFPVLSTLNEGSLTDGQVVEYMTNELITKYGSDKDITAFVDKYDFYMFPIVNVDGKQEALDSHTVSNTGLRL